MRLLHACLIAIVISMAMATPVLAQTTAPATPSLTAGAEFKGLRLDWEPAARASWYELEYRANQAGPFVQVGSDYPASVTVARFRLPLHLFNWTFARYRVAACNSAGCTRSPEVSVSSLRRFAVGYFKPAQTLIGMRFGADTDISPDGLHFVSAAPGESTDGRIYVFRRNSNGTWIQRARLEPQVAPFIEGTNDLTVAISADGNTVVAGMPNYFHTEFDEQSGEVFVFRFNGTSWVRSRLPSGSRGLFGRWVGINDAGDTIAVARGENVDPPVRKSIDIYRLTSGAWQAVRSIGDRPGHTEFCDRGALSRDGSTVVESCLEGATRATARNYVRTHSGPNWTVREDLPLEMSTSSEFGYGNIGVAVDASGNTVAAQICVVSGPNPNVGPAEVHVFRRTAGVFSKVAALSPGAWRQNDQRTFYGLSIALSGDGSTLAVGDSWDNGLGAGPRAAPLNPGTARTGAIYVYRLGSSWRLANMVKPNYSPGGEPNTFGHEVALNGNGHTLLVGQSAEASGADGIGGDWSNSEDPGSGAVWMY